MEIHFYAIITSIAGAVIWQGFLVLYRMSKEFRGDYTGTWVTEILDDTGQVVKVDRLKMKQYKDVLSGSIERKLPEAEHHRKWKFEGRLRGADFFAVFWSVDKSVMSYGCWYVHQQSDNVLNGYYLRLAQQGTSVTTIPLRLTRERRTLLQRIKKTFSRR